MEGLVLESIPHQLLARIILQLYVVPVSAIQHKQINLMTILVAGLQQFGQSSNLDGLFQYCLQATKEHFASREGDQFRLDKWSWKRRDLATPEDWELLSATTPDDHEPVALHIQITAEEVRSSLGLVKYGREASKAKDPRFNYQYKGNPIPINTILQGALSYLETRDAICESIPSLNTTVNAVLNQVEKYQIEQEARQDLQSDIDYILMGALMVRRDGISTAGYGKQIWYLYLRDYIGDAAGALWRVIADDDSPSSPQARISSSQALADIRGCAVPLDDEGVLQPSPASKDYRPVYLFYCNEKIMADASLPAQQHPAEEKTSESAEANRITLEDYTFDDDEYTYEDPQIEDAICKHCGIPDIAEDINNIFFCDECHMGVHQLCEDPPIATFEQDIDPWYCRECSRRKGLPIPPKRPAQDVFAEYWQMEGGPSNSKKTKQV